MTRLFQVRATKTISVLASRMIFCAGLLGAQFAFAQLKIDGHEIPSEIQLNDKKLVLNGYGHRKASFFRKKIYLSALYLESKKSSEASILQSPEIKLLDLVPQYDISAEDSRKAWEHALKENCDPACENWQNQAAEFLASVPVFKVGDRHRYEFLPTGLVVKLNGQIIFKSENPKLARLILATWIGKVPPTEELKAGLLGKSS